MNNPGLQAGDLVCNIREIKEAVSKNNSDAASSIFT